MNDFAVLHDHPTLDLPHVEAELHYLARMTERPRIYTYDPPPGVPRSNTVHEGHVVPIYDLRGIEADISLDREGFELLGQVSAVREIDTLGLRAETHAALMRGNALRVFRLPSDPAAP